MDHMRTYPSVKAVSLVILTLGLILISTLAFGFPEGVIVKVDKPVDAGALSESGILFLGDIGDALLIQCSRVATGGLTEVSAGFKIVAPVSPGKDVFLLRPKSPEDVVRYSAALFEVARGVYLAQLDADDLEDLALLPFSRARLLPRPFIQRKHPVLAMAPVSITPDPEIEDIVAHTSGDSIWKFISQLSGREPVVVNGALDTLFTRYSFGPKIDNTADYLRERFEECCLDVSDQEFILGKYDFYDLDFVDDGYGWVVGYSQRIYKTTDGGLTWLRQKTGAINHIYNDVCFIDTLEGWITGYPGVVYHTIDGGATWANQPIPGTANWMYDVFFLDSLNGWVAGENGEIASTTDGGLTWFSDVTGTTERIYGLWFTSPTRGWACGAGGTILFWDGVSWSAQTSGTADFIRDLCFVDDNTGWAVGADWKVLKTTDGGLNWVPQTVPTGLTQYFMDVSFLDASEGWVGNYGGTILHTTDSGASWELQYPDGAPRIYGVDFVSASDGWIAGLSSAIQHTYDGGTTWVNQTTNLSTGAWAIQSNVVATKPGTVSDDQVIICGHYDSYSGSAMTLAPGADDNASGVAAVLEVARLLAPYPFERTIKFIGLAGEEQGLYGSAEYAGVAQQAGDPILGVINLDMIGYVDVAPEDADIISDSTSEWLADFVIDCCSAYVPTLPTAKTIDPSMAYGDHYSFWGYGYSALDCVEDSPTNYPHIHTTRDTLGHLTQSFATDMVKMVLATVAELAVLDTTVSGVERTEIAGRLIAYPNPFGAATRLSFMTGAAGHVEVTVFDVEGRLVRTLLDTSLGAGRHRVVWDGRDGQGLRVSPGIYFTRVKTDKANAGLKIVLLR